MTHTTQTTVGDGVAAANESLAAAIARQDPGALAALYTRDAQLLPAGTDPIVGRDAIQGFWQAVMESGIGGASLQTDELEDHGDTAVEVGSYTLQVADGQTVDRGKYLVVWKQEEGQWRLHRDMFHTSQPAAQ